jgi:hypothetical protein
MAFAIFKTHCQKCGKQLGLFDGIVCSECFTNKRKSNAEIKQTRDYLKSLSAPKSITQ